MLSNSIGISAFRVVEVTRLSYTTIARTLGRAIEDYKIVIVQCESHRLAPSL
jgi:hypothetical protein